MQLRCDERFISFGNAASHVIGDTPFYPTDGTEPRVPGDISGLGRPGRDSAGTRYREEQVSLMAYIAFDFGAIGQQLPEDGMLLSTQRISEVSKVNVFRCDARHCGNLLLQRGQKFLSAKGRKSGGATQNQHRGTSLKHRGVLKEGAIVLDPLPVNILCCCCLSLR